MIKYTVEVKPLGPGRLFMRFYRGRVLVLTRLATSRAQANRWKLEWEKEVLSGDPADHEMRPYGQRRER